TAWLKDAETNTLYDLSTEHPTFAFAGGHAYEGRFSVVFKAVVVSEVTGDDEPGIRIYSNGDKVFIQRPSSDAASITISNVLGQQVAELVSHQEKTEIQLCC